MRSKAVSGIIMTLLLTSMLTLTFNIQPVRASGTIYIRPDGSIDPPMAAISTSDNVTYTFINDIFEPIRVERSNIVIDGNGFNLQGPGNEKGFHVYDLSNVTIRNTNIKNFDYGIWLEHSSYNTVLGNNITNNDWHGINLYDSLFNNISKNNLVNNTAIGIFLCARATLNKIQIPPRHANNGAVQPRIIVPLAPLDVQQKTGKTTHNIL